jgi:hypothetical protein
MLIRRRIRSTHDRLDTPVNSLCASSSEGGADSQHHEDEPGSPEYTARPSHSACQFFPCPSGESRVERCARVRVH